ncbi:MAG: HlyC/CorC family transporter [Ignavibacteriales bacterium]|nr:HlyC/CorC family transporter [Ignavibacteriales bacterium]
MDLDWSIKLVLIFFLLLSSAFFSGSEVALFSLDRKQLESGLDKSGFIYRYLTNLINFPRRLLVTILIGNTLVNVAVSIVAVSLAMDVAAYFNMSMDIILVIQIVVITILILLFGELFPKVIASKNPFAFAKFIAVPLNLCSIMIYPIAESITEIIKISSSKLSFDKSKSALTKEELIDLANIGKEKGTIEDDEHSLISSLVSFAGLSVNEVMTPRVDIKAVSVDDDYDKIVTVITKSGHSRIPVYMDSIDEIVGVIFAKDLLLFIKSPELVKNFSLKSLIKKPLFIPETKLINELLKEFQEKKVHLAIVVDEYGGTAGLITLEDIIEEVVGDIWDEFDKEENHLIKIDDNRFMALGKTKLEEINETLGVNILVKDDDYDTLGGFILSKAGSIPKDNFTFIDYGIKFVVNEVQNKRIKKVILEKLNTAADN